MDKFKKELVAALKSERGIKVFADDPHFHRQKLYAAARELAVGHLLLITISPNNPNELWIIQRSELNNGKIKEPARKVRKKTKSRYTSSF